MNKLFDLYKRMLLLHIKTKTTDIVFHQASESFYNSLFDVFHTISEKRQDIEEDDGIDCEQASQEAYDILEDAKAELEDMIAGDNTYGMDNLLRGLVDKIESECGTARGFIKEESEE